MLSPIVPNTNPLPRWVKVIITLTTIAISVAVAVALLKEVF